MNGEIRQLHTYGVNSEHARWVQEQKQQLKEVNSVTRKKMMGGI